MRSGWLIFFPDDLFSVRHSGLGTNETGDRAASHNPGRGGG